MSRKIYTVKDITTGKKYNWSFSRILKEINRDRSSEWTPYNKVDWREGWNEWCEGDYYTLLNVTK